MLPIHLFKGVQRAMYEKVLEAFAAGDAYMYRFDGLRFRGSTAIVTIRKYGTSINSFEPFTVRIPFNKRTSVRTILKALRAGGYGTRAFRRKPTSPDAESGASAVVVQIAR
jgi:hypothetical protein